MINTSLPPTQTELHEWRETLRLQFVRQCESGDLRNYWPASDFAISRTLLAEFVASWKQRCGWYPETWDILAHFGRCSADQQRLLREAEQACLDCGIDPRGTTLTLNRYYRYLRDKELPEFPQTERESGKYDAGEIWTRWREIEGWFKRNPRRRWCWADVFRELDEAAKARG